MDELKKIIALLGLLALAGCGSRDQTTIDNATSLGVSIIGIKIATPNSLIELIDHISIEITANDIAAPILVHLSAEQQEALIDNVPKGTNRTITANAITKDGRTIKTARIEDIDTTDDTTDVVMELNTIPAIINIKDGATIDNTRLTFHIMSDPLHIITIEDITDVSNSLVINTDTNAPELKLNEGEIVGTIRPTLITPGTHTFKVVDLTTNLSSNISVTIIDGTKRRPAPIFAAVNNTSRCGMIGGIR